MSALAGRLEKTVRVLSEDIGVRSFADLPQLAAAAKYIEHEFRSSGCGVSRQAFRYRGNEYFNIIAEVTGTGGVNNGTLIIGAHYDTAWGTPGADDNGSGVAALIELARATAASPAPRTVRFIAFCLEEPPVYMTKKMGSYVYAHSIRAERRAVLGMVSLEMLGFFTDAHGSQLYPASLFRFFYPGQGNFIAFVGNISSRRFIERFKSTFRSVSAFPVESLSGLSIIPGVDFSDHRNFWKFGIPAFMITDTAFYRNPNYHGPGDRADTLNYPKMAELTDALAKTIVLI